jgi:formate dehydrogenase major subunit
LNPLRGQNNVQGGGDTGAIPNKLPGFQDVQDDHDARARFEAAWETKLPPQRGWHLSQMFEAMERGELRTLYVLGENPAQSEADSNVRHPRLRGHPQTHLTSIGTSRPASKANH